MKKLFALLLAAVMVSCLFAGCKPADEGTETTAAAETTEATGETAEATGEATEEATDATETMPEAGLIKQVALVTDVGTIDDESFNQACWQGVENWCKANNIPYDYLQPSEDSTDARVLSIAKAIQDGANCIVMPGFLFGASVVTIQDEYPDVYFVAVDVGAGDLTLDFQTFAEPSANVACLTFSEEQAGYLAGYAAVKEGYTKLGFLGGMAVPAVQRYGYGFIQGADKAAQEMSANIEINYTYGGAFAGSPEITAKMEGWYGAGTEVVFACGGGIYTSALEAAANHDGKVIGVDVDQRHLSDLFITSALKGLQNVTETVLSELNAGNWATYGGQVTNFGLMEGDYVGLATAEGSWQLNNYTVEENDALKAQITDGTVVVSNETEEVPTVSDFVTLNMIG